MQEMKFPINFLPLVVAFVLGCIIALITSDIGFFVYENKFNIFELLYFVLSVVIALFISNRIDDALQRRRSQKDLILKKIEEVDATIKGLNDLFHFDNNKFNLANTTFLNTVKNIGMWAKRYEESISIYYPDLEKQVGYTKINTRELVKTCTKITDKNGDDISCVNDIWYYSEGKFVEITYQIELLRNICYNNMILLNNCA